jgi:hypothetical protein
VGPDELINQAGYPDYYRYRQGNGQHRKQTSYEGANRGAKEFFHGAQLIQKPNPIPIPPRQGIQEVPKDLPKRPC